MADISVAAEPIAHIAQFTITNSMLNAWIGIAIFVAVGLFVKSRVTLAPRGFMNLFDGLIEFTLNEVQKVTGDRERARKFFPICGTLFFFILLSNWMGLIPGVGSIGIHELKEGEDVLVPLFRPVAADLNFTLAIAIFSVLAIQVFGVMSLGPVAYFSKFVNILGIIKSLKHGPMAVVIALVEFCVGLLEIISEFAKTLSLALRLFGNIFAGEVLLTVIYSLVSYLVPLPFMFLELLVGAIQATVFGMLVLVFMKAATDSHAEEAH